MCAQEPKILARLGFLYEGYSMAYWETFQMVLKLLLAAVPVFVPAQPYGSTQVHHISPVVPANFLKQTWHCRISEGICSGTVRGGWGPEDSERCGHDPCGYLLP